MTNHALQILFAPREHRDANTYSEMLGTYTAKGTSTGRSVNLGPGAGGSNSETGSDQRRPLLLPQELKALSDDEQVIVLENTKPIMCAKAKFFRDRRFIDRLKAMSETLRSKKGLPDKALLDKVAFGGRELAIDVPALDIDGHVARIEQRTRPMTADDPIDLSRLDMDVTSLPTFEDPQKPSRAEALNIVNAFFALGEIDTAPVDLTLAEDTQTENMLVEA